MEIISVALPEEPCPKNNEPVAQEVISLLRYAVTVPSGGLPNALLPTNVLANPVEGGLLPCQFAATAKSPKFVWLKKRS